MENKEVQVDDTEVLLDEAAKESANRMQVSGMKII